MLLGIIKKRKTFIIVACAVVFISTVVFLLVKNKGLENKPASQVFLPETGAITYSRISFFNNSAVHGSVKMPDYWEGKYRLIEEGNKAIFFNISNPEKQSEIFYIKIYDSGVWQETKENKLDEIEITEKNNKIFVYKLSTGKFGDGKENRENKKMINDILLIIASFK